MDGRAHVDPELKEAYAAICRGNSLCWTFHDVGGNVLLSESPVLTNVRQIAFELESTSSTNCPTYSGRTDLRSWLRCWRSPPWSWMPSNFSV
jgi:hypothetical protein